MRDEWTVSKRKLGGFSCIEHKETRELCLSGSRGELWLVSSTEARAVLVSKDTESLYTFPVKDIPAWRKRLDVPLDPRAQLKWANGFSSRIK